MSALPPEEQDRIARRLLGEIQDEERWTQAFSSSQGTLSRLANEARADTKAGRATQLDLDKPTNCEIECCPAPGLRGEAV